LPPKSRSRHCPSRHHCRLRSAETQVLVRCGTPRCGLLPADIEYAYSTRVSIESSEFENSWTKLHVQTAVHASLLHEPVINRCDGQAPQITAAVKPNKCRLMWKRMKRYDWHLFCWAWYRHQSENGSAQSNNKSGECSRPNDSRKMYT